MTYSSQAISMHQGKKKLYFLLETESSTPHEWEGCFHVTNLITASENKQQNDCFCCLSKLSANNNLRWFRRTQMKERITKRRGKIVQTEHTILFWKVKTFTACTDKHNREWQSLPTAQASVLSPGLKCGHLDIVHPSLVPRVRPFGSVHKNSKKVFCMAV